MLFVSSGSSSESGCETSPARAAGNRHAEQATQKKRISGRTFCDGAEGDQEDMRTTRGVSQGIIGRVCGGEGVCR